MLRLFLLIAFFPSAIVSLNNGLALTPPMGYRTWEQLSININAHSLIKTIDAFALPRSSLNGKSLVDLGYNNVAADDGWQPAFSSSSTAPGINGGFHDKNGMPIVSNITFPGGFKPLSKHAKNNGQTFSWYTNNCGDGQSPPETNYTDPKEIQQHYWGDIHYSLVNDLNGFKVDGCGQFNSMQTYADLANATGKKMLFESCHPLDTSNDPYIDPVTHELVCNFHYFRTSADVSFSFDSVLGNINSLHKWENISRPGCWGHPDMLEIGNLWTVAEDQTNFGLYCITSSPLILSFDLTDEIRMKQRLPIFSNQEAIDINQQWVGHPGKLIQTFRQSDKTQYLDAVPCNSTEIQGWSFRDVAPIALPASNSNSSINKDIRTVQIVAPNGIDCVDLIIQAPLRVVKCNVNTSTQILEYNTITGHLGKSHPMQDGSSYGYINVGSKVGPLTQFTKSYGTDQCNEEYYIDIETGIFSTRCGDGKKTHDVAEPRCMKTVNASKEIFVDNNSEHFVRNITHQIWAKPLRNGEIAVLVVNRAIENGLKFLLQFDTLMFGSNKTTEGTESKYRVRDVWKHKDLGIFNNEYLTDNILPHGNVFLRLTPVR